MIKASCSLLFFVVCGMIYFSSAPAFSKVFDNKVLTVDLAEDHVGITTGFNGASLVLYGVRGQEGQVAIVVKGPKKDHLVRHKSSVLGVWMNRQSVLYKNVPQFYDFALSDDEENILDEAGRKEHGIGFQYMTFKPQDTQLPKALLSEFLQAFIRNKQADKLFPLKAKDIIFLSDSFFKTELYLPSNVPTGLYVIETFLIRDNSIIDKRVTNVEVAQVGVSAGMHKFAYSYPAAYAILIVFIAVLAGWLSNAVRHKV